MVVEVSGAPDLTPASAAPSVLKVCAHCGSDDAVLREYPASRIDGHPTGDSRFGVDCMNCGIETAKDKTAQQAISDWNARLPTEGILAIIEQETMIERAQDIITNYLVPDGYTAAEAIALLIEHFDGPNQRRVKAIVDHALATVVDGTTSSTERSGT